MQGLRFGQLQLQLLHETRLLTPCCPPPPAPALHPLPRR